MLKFKQVSKKHKQMLVFLNGMPKSCSEGAFFFVRLGYGNGDVFKLKALNNGGKTNSNKIHVVMNE